MGVYFFLRKRLQSIFIRGVGGGVSVGGSGFDCFLILSKKKIKVESVIPKSIRDSEKPALTLKKAPP